MNRRAALTWAVIVGSVAGGVTFYDIRCHRRGDDSTLSSVTRHVVAVTPGGPVLFTVGLAAAGLWFRTHILRPLAVAAADAKES